MRKAPALLAVCVLAACGGSATTQPTVPPSTQAALKAAPTSRSPKRTTAKAQIQATQRAYLAAAKADHVGDMCRLTADQADCLGTVATLKAFGIKPSDTLSGNEEHLIATMRVVVSGNHARTGRGNQMIRRNGAWLMVLKDKS